MVRDKILKFLEAAALSIQDKKGENIIGIDVSHFSTLTNYFIVAQGNVSRHVRALSKEVVETLSDMGVDPLNIEGLKHGDWVVLDYGDFIIHLMQEDMREKYRLEEIWKEGRIVDLHLRAAI
ncbi:MAG: ribosome silencing factor [Chlamydiia bacterium]|nr:ribosome silencing factor [Chlamydiia bacterium]